MTPDSLKFISTDTLSDLFAEFETFKLLFQYELPPNAIDYLDEQIKMCGDEYFKRCDKKHALL